MPDQGRESEPARLNGWKEIANYLGKGVRTVQRWEKELGLPVHRIHTAAGEIVYAYASEIHRWLAESESQRLQVAGGRWQVAGGGLQSPPTEAGKMPALQQGSPSRQAEEGLEYPAAGAERWRWPTVAVLLALAGLGTALWLATGRSRGQPAIWRVEDNKLRVFDAQGKALWEYHGDSPLVETAYRQDNLPGRLVAIEDLDNDGNSEVLFVGSPEEAAARRLCCFDSGGRRRFSYEPSRAVARSVTFGSEEYASPFVLLRFFLTATPEGKKHIWAVSLHNLWFPAVLQKLDASGQVLGEYWSNGHILTVKDGVIGGRHYLLVGATNNEHYGASLAVLDYDNPTGSAPAQNPYYRCMTCPAGQPLAFLVFPRMESSREFNTRPYVSDIRVQPGGYLSVAVLQPALPVSGELEPLDFPVFYRLNSQFEVIEAEIGDTYEQGHVRLELMGRLKHRFGPRCERELWPVLAWNGERFVAVRPGR